MKPKGVGGSSSAREMSALAALLEQEKGLKQFRYSDLERATKNFSKEMMVGDRGFGQLYRGVLDHQELAIKRVLIKSDQQKKEHISSAVTTSILRHRNLVRIVGWSHKRGDWLLIYEFIPNGELRLRLHNRSENVLAWEIRLRVALGLASSLHYLHEENAMSVVHRDVNRSNVMLDADFNAKLGGFGLALHLDHETSFTDDYPVAWTIGLAPELFQGGVIGKAYDVYGFGVVALEIACGKRPFVSSFDDSEDQGRGFLVEWVRSLHAKGLVLEAADERLLNRFDQNQMKSLLLVGLWCVQRDPELRPSMRQVINVLKGEAPLPEVPAYDVLSGMDAVDADEAEAPLPRLSAHHVVLARMNETEGGEVEAPSLDLTAPTEMPDMVQHEDFEIGIEEGPKKFSYTDLEHATENFLEARKIGEGGFSAVYKGLLNGGEVAIKRVWSGSKHAKKQYISEVETISDLRHRNLVRLVGYCHERGEFLLVCEFIPNGDLNSHLYNKKRVLSWENRFKIVVELASALYYLHEEYKKCVCHRDVKPRNVMLDADFNVKLGDFGLAFLIDHERTSKPTEVVAGTVGYRAPEAFLGDARKESDVFSFGVVALEIACGRKPIVDDDEDPGRKINLVEWVTRRYVKGLIVEAADRRLNMMFEKKQMKSLMTIGLWCAQQDYRLRPSMRQVIGVLKGEAPLPKLDLPAYKGRKWITMWLLSRR